MSNKISIEIKNCIECPFIKTILANEPFKNGNTDFSKFDWFCEKSKKQIQKEVEFFEVDKIEIPKWCEIKIE